MLSILLEIEYQFSPPSVDLKRPPLIDPARKIFSVTLSIVLVAPPSIPEGSQRF